MKKAKYKVRYEKMRDRVKTAWEKSRSGVFGGPVFRFFVFLFFLFSPILITLLITIFVVVLLAGGIVAIMQVDPDAKVKDNPTADSGQKNPADSRQIEVPEHLKGKLLYPAGIRLTSKKGQRGSEYHLGIDLAGSYNGDWNIYPVYPGKVTMAKYSTSFGNVIVVRHDVNGTVLYSLYGHLKVMNVKTGDEVGYNTSLGIMGNTGTASRGVHLHLEIHDANFVYGGSAQRKKTVLTPTDFLYCTANERLSNEPQSTKKCMDYRMSVTKQGG